MKQNPLAQKGYSPIADFLPPLMGVCLLVLSVVFIFNTPLDIADSGNVFSEGWPFYLGVAFGAGGGLLIFIFLLQVIHTKRYGNWVERDIIDGCKDQVHDIQVAAGYHPKDFENQFRKLRDKTTVHELLNIHEEGQQERHLRAIEALVGRAVSADDTLQHLVDALLQKISPEAAPASQH